MATSIDTEPGIQRAAVAQPVRRTIKPIKWWAALGIGWLALIAYSVTRYFLGGHAGRISTGSDEVPGSMVAAIRVHEVVFISVGLTAFYFAIIRPWRRERRLALDGMIFIAITLMWFQDPLLNYGQMIFVYNSEFLNIGCPQCFLPGWLSNGANYTETLWSFLFYFGFAWLAIKGGMRLMTWARGRWPQMGTPGLAAFTVSVFFVFDLIIEMIWLRLGLYVYTMSGPLVLFAGRHYQLPLHEIFFAGIWFATVAFLWFFRNDKGETFAERGSDRLRVTGKHRTALRLLAIIGLFNTAVAVTYNFPMAWIGIESSHWPKDTYSRSYFTHGMCGPNTNIACPESRLPIPKEGSATITPDGKLFAPKGLPNQNDK